LNHIAQANLPDFCTATQGVSAPQHDRRYGEDDCSQQRADREFRHLSCRFLERLLFSTAVIA
jgi:hypothetical protein